MRISHLQQQHRLWLTVLKLLVVAILVSLAITVVALVRGTKIQAYTTTISGAVNPVSVEIVRP